LRPKYNTFGSVTGRCTATSPAILNLPKTYRHFITASEGKVIIESDYSQMEIGVLAALSNDKQLIDDFNTGDVYLMFAGKAAITRDDAKQIVLGIIYGMSPKSVSLLLHIDVGAAIKLINEFYSVYPNVKAYLDNQIIDGEKNGYVQSITGLKRYRAEEYSSQGASFWEKNWFKNFPIQASAAAIFKTAIIELNKELHEQYIGDFKLLVPHYDALVYQVPTAKEQHYVSQVEQAMIRAMIKFLPVLRPKISTSSPGKEWQA